MAIKYKWIAERLELMMNKNSEKGIYKLPTEQELCTKYHVSRQTIRMALGLLEEKGLIIKKQGSGSYYTGRSANPDENVIGILLSSDQEYIYPQVLNDIRNTLAGNGFSDQVFTTDNCVHKEREFLLKLLERPLRGIIVEGCKSALPNPNLDLYRRLIKKGCQVVFLFNYYPALSDCVVIKDNNYYGSSLLVRHLAAQGHTAIGSIFKADDLQGIERYQGYIETMRDFDLPISDHQVCWFGSHELDKLIQDKDTGFLRNMVEESLSLCTAVICYNDMIAYYLADQLLLAGFRLPADMAIVSFDNTYLSTSKILTVTSLSHRPHEMGIKAGEAMNKKLRGEPVSSEEISWKLNIKESTLTER